LFLPLHLSPYISSPSFLPQAEARKQREAEAKAEAERAAREEKRQREVAQFQVCAWMARWVDGLLG
jgi:hypothetical protein